LAVKKRFLEVRLGANVEFQLRHVCLILDADCAMFV
jgi:hypothetical protein